MTATTSLVRRIAIGIVLAELLCASALTVISIGHERSVRLRAIDVSLEGRADSLFGAVQDAEDAGDNIFLDPREVKVPRDDVYGVYDQSGKLIGSSAIALPELIRPEHGGVQTRHVDGHSYRVLQRDNLRIIDRLESGGVGLRRPVTIVYATRTDQVWRGIFHGIGFYLVASVVLIVGTTVIMIGIMRRALQPVRDLAAAAAAVSPRRLYFEAPHAALQTSELRPLAETLSTTIAGLRTAVELQHRFVGDAAHELKTALAVLRSSLQVLLLRPRSPAEYEAGVEKAVEDNRRLEELVARMLFLARLEEQTERIHLQPRSNLATVTKETLRRFGPMFELSGIALRHTISGTGFVGLQASDVDVLVSNLVLNAVEHSPRDSVVSVSVARSESEIVLQVSDQGEGMPPDALEHVFERFYRVDSSRARSTGGAGLGLSICKAIVASASGRIELRSVPGSGTTATVALPVQ